MLELKEIDFLIYELLEYLANIQCVDGSFKTYFKHAELSQNEWVNNGKRNAPIDTASTVLPLLNLNNSVSKNIVIKGVDFIKQTTSILPLWRYYPSSGQSFVIPYDMDSTCLSSFVLENIGENQKNKELLYYYQNESGYYLTYLFPKKNKDLSFFQDIVFRYQSWRNSKSDTISIFINDIETATTCNALLYLGVSGRNSSIFEQVKSDIFSYKIKRVYFSEFYSLYSFARCCFYNQVNDLFKTEIRRVNLINSYLKNISSKTSLLDLLYFVNSCLFFKLENYDLIQEQIIQIFDRLQDKQYLEVSVFFASHNVLTEGSLSFFGSQGILAATALELLNLYHLRFFGCYYSEKQILKT